MKTAISAPVIWLVLAALADPVAAQVDIPRRSPVGEAIEAREAAELEARNQRHAAPKRRRAARSGGAQGEDAHSEAPRG